MDQNTHTWNQLTLPFDNKLKNVLEQQHLAMQFIGLAGRHLIPEQKDKSNVSMEFLPHEKIFVGKQLQNDLRIAFHPETHSLEIRGKELEILKGIKLEGKTFENVFHELKNALHELGTDVSKLTTEQPYELHSDSLKEGKFFQKDKMVLTEETIRYRNNAKLVLHEIISKYEDTDLVRIWPHHFDTGTVIHLEKNQSGETIKSIGLGFAIPDDMVAEPYFYLSFWSESSNSSVELPQNLTAGKWMMPEWDGAVLPVSEIQQMEGGENQYNLTKSFFEAGISKSIVLLETD